MIKVCIAGAGFMGQTHFAAYSHLPNARVIHVVDRNLARAADLAEKCGASASASLEEALSDPAIDLVDITLPTPEHPGAAVAAFAASKHVVLEKPLALTIEDVDSILAAAQASGKFLFPAHVLRFWPEYMAIKQEIDSGRMGRPISASAMRLSNMPQWATWFSDPLLTGGAVLDLHIHDVDMLNYLLGTPERVHSAGVQSAAGGWDHVMTLLEYPGARAWAEASFTMPQDYPFSAGLRVQCEAGVIEYQFRAGGASFDESRSFSYIFRHEPGKPNQPIKVEDGDAFNNEIAYFVECVEKNCPPVIVTGQDARLAVQTCLAARRSLETGTTVNVAGVHGGK